MSKSAHALGPAPRSPRSPTRSGFSPSGKSFPEALSDSVSIEKPKSRTACGSR